jgi:hypothetical protein
MYFNFLLIENIENIENIDVSIKTKSPYYLGRMQTVAII